MYTPHSGQNFPPAPGSRRGIALVLVLFTVLVLTLIVIAIIANGTSEIRSSKVYANGSSVKLLAQSAVNIVIAEISDGTKGLDSSSNTLCWASQPGMIRTYNTSGSLVTCYKLYSDSQMVDVTNSFSTTGAAPPSTWYSQPGVYVDLNEPVEVSGTNYYPIIDGNPADYQTSGGTTCTVTVPTSTLFSGTLGNTLAQTGTNSPQVAGFWVDPQYTPTNSTTTNQAVPMPVKWLYVLKDGTVIVPDSNSSPVTFANVTQEQPSQSNPIVGRMAFWTDDESCKINVNTASESMATTNNIASGNSAVAGSFIDTPRVCTKYDESMAIYPAVQNEFQRYPGHPATVSLSTVFGSWLNDGSYPENIYPLTPRINNGGSTEGTIQYATQSTTGTGSLQLRTDRLYDTPDEFVFQQNMSSSSNLATRIPNSSANTSSTNLSTSGTKLAASTELDGNALNKAKFFITASSRAPDVNLFNQPRVCLWPISSISGTSNRTPYDNVIAFCETLGATPTTTSTNIYYFQRGDADSLVSGSNTDIGVGKGYGWESTTENTDIGRNQTLINYLRYFCGKPIPGFGGSTFASKYNTGSPTGGSGTEIDQILMEIFDYIRCTNIHDTSQGTTFHYFSNTATTGTNTAMATNDGLVVPTINTSAGTKGFGRFPTISGAALQFIAAGEGPSTSNGPDVLSQAFDIESLNAGATSIISEPPFTTFPNAIRVQASLLFSLFDPSQGFYGDSPNIILEVIPNLKWDAGTQGTPNTMLFGPVTTTSNSIPADGGHYFYLTASPVNDSNPPWGGEMGTRIITGHFGNGSAGNFIDYPLATGLPFLVTNKLTHASTSYFGNPVTGKAPDYPSGSSIQCSGTVTVNLYLGVSSGEPSFSTLGQGSSSTALSSSFIIEPHSASSVSNSKIQSFTFTFPSSTNTFPLPTDASELTAGNLPSGAITYGTNTVYLNSLNNAILATTTTTTNYYVPVAGTGYGRYYSSGAQYPYPILNGDTVESLVSYSGDLRLSAALAAVSSSFSPHPLYATSSQMAHCFMEQNGLILSGATRGQYIKNIAQYWVGGVPVGNYYTYSPFGGNTNPTTNYQLAGSSCEPEGFGMSPTSSGGTGLTAGGGTSTAPGDWDNGTGSVRDGPYINKPDEGDIGLGTFTSSGPSFYPAYYTELYNTTGGTSRGQGAFASAYFSPARIMPSAVMLGSLPTGVFKNAAAAPSATGAWQTLLFHPDYTGTHIGAQSPPDYLLLDFFHMPVVEPYAISEPLSTAGRINMNYLIEPFTYINRDTGIRAVLQSQQMLAIPNTAAYGTASGNNGYVSLSTPVNSAYKQVNYAEAAPNFSSVTPATYRFPINDNQTLEGFLNRFTNNDIFHSASEICSLDLIPNDTTSSPAPSYGNMQTYWQNHALTGHNSRERPYANIYPLLTTKSNTFTIHFRVQTLKQALAPAASSTAWKSWREGTDLITAEYRGSQTVERYVDPTNSALASNPSFDYAQSLGSSSPTTPSPLPYQFRVVSSTQFSP